MTDAEIRIRLRACRELNPFKIVGTDNNSHWGYGFLAGARNEEVLEHNKSNYCYLQGYHTGRSWQQQVFPQYEAASK